MIGGPNNIPHANERDSYVDGEGSLKLDAQSETLIVIPRVH